MAKTRKILYVDDEPINLMLFELNFNKLYDIRTASSGEEALNILSSEEDIEAVITDMNMPEMDGIAFINEASKRFPELLFFMLTGFEITSGILQLLEAGILKECFQKPMNIDQIQSVINPHLTK